MKILLLTIAISTFVFYSSASFASEETDEEGIEASTPVSKVENGGMTKERSELDADRIVPHPGLVRPERRAGHCSRGAGNSGWGCTFYEDNRPRFTGGHATEATCKASCFDL